jgi:hypothetical protein
MNLQTELLVSSGPHIRSSESTRTIMLDVLAALLPALGVGVYFFGVCAFMLVLVCVASCVFFEALYQKIMHSRLPSAFFSSVVTGCPLALNFPVEQPGGWPCRLFLRHCHSKSSVRRDRNELYQPPAWPDGPCWLLSRPDDGLVAIPSPMFPCSEGGRNESATILNALNRAKSSAIPLWTCFLEHRGCIGEISAPRLIVGRRIPCFQKGDFPESPCFNIGTCPSDLHFPEGGRQARQRLKEIRAAVYAGRHLPCHRITPQARDQKRPGHFRVGFGL